MESPVYRRERYEASVWFSRRSISLLSREASLPSPLSPLIIPHIPSLMFYSAAVLLTVLSAGNAFTPAAPQRMMKATTNMMADPWFPSSTTTNTVDVKALEYVHFLPSIFCFSFYALCFNYINSMVAIVRHSQRQPQRRRTSSRPTPTGTSLTSLFSFSKPRSLSSARSYLPRESWARTPLERLATW